MIVGLKPVLLLLPDFSAEKSQLIKSVAYISRLGGYTSFRMNSSQLSLSAAQQRLEQLNQQLKAANEAYFNHDQNLVPEPVRDQLKKELLSLEAQFPQLVTADSYSQRVGAPLEGRLEKVSHQSAKYSLSDVFSAEELSAFITRVQKLCPQPSLEFSVERKVDGLNITLWYEKGKFKKALTRGDGKLGEDVTHTIRTIHQLPLELPEPLTVQFSGECFITHADFLALQKHSATPWANPRNLAAGTVRQLDPQVAAQRGLQCVIYDAEGLETKTQTELVKKLQEWNFPVHPLLGVWSDPSALMDFCEQQNADPQRIWQDIETDGLVIKIHDFATRKLLGSTAKTVRWAVAWKFPPLQQYTTLREVTFQVGRTGAVTPVAILDPIVLAGSTVQRATLHNAEEITRKDIRLGDSVIVEKAGDIIPAVVGALPNLRNGSEVPITFPTHCPACRFKLIAVGPVSRCNSPTCAEQQIQRLIFSAEKLDIPGLGTKTIVELFQRQKIKNMADFWRLTALDLAPLPNWKEKKIQNLLAALDQYRAFPFEQLVAALGIRHLGAENARLWAEHCVQTHGQFTLQQAAGWEISAENLTQVKGLGPVIAQSVVAHWDLICEHFKALDAVGVTLRWEAAPESQNGFFRGKNVVITGTFEDYKRDDLKKLIQQQGGKYLSSISPQVDYLICGDAPGKKLLQATELKIPVLKVADLKKLSLPISVTDEKKAANPPTLFS